IGAAFVAKDSGGQKLLSPAENIERFIRGCGRKPRRLGCALCTLAFPLKTDRRSVDRSILITPTHL
ncbi:MAG: hypothetical protein WA728_04985, partial [Xanthobacteraceae bacterium]